MSEVNAVRLNKYLSEVGYCSRRAADKLIDEGRVTVNGKIPEMGTKVLPTDQIKVDGKAIDQSEQQMVYLAFNKPVGVVCTTSKKDRDNIIDFINYPERIYPVGRLDKQSEGLIFLTNDGEIVNKILRGRHQHEKEYIVTVNKPITNEFIKGMSQGVPILDTVTRPCEVQMINKHKFRIILTQGLNRQIRRMCEHFDYKVNKLKRVRIMNIQLDIPVGKWRYFTTEELSTLNDLIKDSH